MSQSNSNSNSILEKLEDGKVIIPLKKCRKCNTNIIEMFKTPIEGTTSFENLLFEILQDKDRKLKVRFNSFVISCPECGESTKDITYIELEEEDIKLLNSTPLSKIYVTVNPM